MSIIMSSTIEQEEKIKSLSVYLFEQVLPQYIHDEMIQIMEQEKFFHIDDEALEYIESLSDASRVITALNTIISILESKTLSSGYEELFSESVQILRCYQIVFPFPLSFFVENKPSLFF